MESVQVGEREGGRGGWGKGRAREGGVKPERGVQSYNHTVGHMTVT